MGISLYIHIPFCKSKCMYCDFCSYSGKENMMMEYTRALCDEILLNCKNKSIATIFIGGGTPTYLSLEAWELIKNTLDKLQIDKNAEFSVECNPGTIDSEKLAFFKTMGVNRISIGLQAWQDSLLKKIGRIHSKDDFVRSFSLIRNQGFNNINIDIMFGLPNQKLADIKETLENVEALKPEHISCYSLIIEEGTPFADLYEKGELSLPDETEERDMYQYAVDFLKHKGYSQYEISNFSKVGLECRHNITYWKLKEYIGCGAAAHSYVEGIRYRNEEDIRKYIEAVKINGLAVLESSRNTQKDDMEEYMFMGLRMLEGVSKEEFFKRFGVEVTNIYGDIVKKYIKLDLMKECGQNIALTGRGIELSNSIMSDFILDK